MLRLIRSVRISSCVADSIELSGAKTPGHLAFECRSTTLEAAVNGGGNDPECPREEQRSDRKHERDAPGEFRLVRLILQGDVGGGLHIGADQANLIHEPLADS